MTSSTATRSASSAKPTGRWCCPGPSPSMICLIWASPCPKGHTRPWLGWPLTAWGAYQKRARPLGSTAGSWRSWPSNTAPSPAYASPPPATTSSRQLTSGPIPHEPTLAATPAATSSGPLGLIVRRPCQGTLSVRFGGHGVIHGRVLGALSSLHLEGVDRVADPVGHPASSPSLSWP